MLRANKNRNGSAIRRSKYDLRIMPPLLVTLNLPSRGLMSASSVGNKMYGASTAS